MREHPWLAKLLEAAVDHPLTTLILALFFVLAVGLGVLHELRIFADCFLVLIDHLKGELIAGRDTLRRIKRALTSWDREPRP